MICSLLGETKHGREDDVSVIRWICMWCVCDDCLCTRTPLAGHRPNMHACINACTALYTARSMHMITTLLYCIAHLCNAALPIHSSDWHPNTWRSCIISSSQPVLCKLPHALRLRVLVCLHAHCHLNLLILHSGMRTTGCAFLSLDAVFMLCHDDQINQSISQSATDSTTAHLSSHFHTHLCISFPFQTAQSFTQITLCLRPVMSYLTVRLHNHSHNFSAF